MEILILVIIVQPYNNVVGFPNRETVKIAATDSNITLRLDITRDNNILMSLFLANNSVQT